MGADTSKSILLQSNIFHLLFIINQLSIVQPAGYQLKEMIKISITNTCCGHAR